MSLLELGEGWCVSVVWHDLPPYCSSYVDVHLLSLRYRWLSSEHVLL